MSFKLESNPEILALIFFSFWGYKTRGVPVLSDYKNHQWHCVKSVRTRSFPCLCFPGFWLNTERYGEGKLRIRSLFTHCESQCIIMSTMGNSAITNRILSHYLLDLQITKKLKQACCCMQRMSDNQTKKGLNSNSWYRYCCKINCCLVLQGLWKFEQARI